MHSNYVLILIQGRSKSGKSRKKIVSMKSGPVIVYTFFTIPIDLFSIVRLKQYSEQSLITSPLLRPILSINLHSSIPVLSILYCSYPRQSCHSRFPLPLLSSHCLQRIILPFHSSFFRGTTSPAKFHFRVVLSIKSVTFDLTFDLICVILSLFTILFIV